MARYNNAIQVLEYQELIQKLIDNGYGDIVDCLLEETSYTKRGRLNKSSACRTMEWKGKQLEDAMKEMQALLSKDMSFD